MSVLSIEGLRAGIAGKEILRGIDLKIESGEIHAVMGPNGAGKSTLGNVLLGHPSYEVLGGSVRLDGVELLGLPTWERARAGLFLAPQDPIEIPGVPLRDVLAASLATGASGVRITESSFADEIAAIGVDSALLARGLNVDCSGGEKKRIETLQLVAFAPRIALLDEIDSGLDIDALRAVVQRIERAARNTDNGTELLGVLAVTHYRRLLDVLRPDVVHIMVDGRIVESGDLKLAAAIEHDGYASYAGAVDAPN